ncbi:solute carrier family 23 member 1-like, partial [Diadema antillarum]|uniref:solute carrier family 23 member 1-like n=1 Tax=Diadema antillarum TaxID=105358 RepID=UPI003A86CAC2
NPNGTPESNGAADVAVAIATTTASEPVILSSEEQKAKEILDDLKGDLSYSIEEIPAWYTSILLGFQHYLTMVGATVAIPLIIAPALCIADDYVATAEIIGTIFFVSGIATLLQSFFGVRLPIVQGGTFSFLVPTFAILGVKGPCLPSLTDNATAEERANHTEFWQSRMRELQGDIMVASLFQVVIGFTGTIGLLLRFIGPLSIAPTIALIGISLFPVASDFAGSHWGIAVLTIGLMVIFSQYLARFSIPCLGFSRSKGCHKTNLFLFKLFPVIMAILLSWVFAFILTETNVFPTDPDSYGYNARTDLRVQVLNEAAWFRIPYPGQWGLPTISVAGVFGMLAGVLASMIESVGDYYACARLSGAPPPPSHAVSRGIGMEGIGCVIAGAIGSGNGTTSYSENIGAIGITKVGSRRVIQMGGLLMIILGCLSKFGALFVMIPDPIVGGMFFVMFGMVAAVGLSNLKFVDLTSTRNLFILGFSILAGLCIPYYIQSNPDFIQTGVAELDQIIEVLLSTSMFVGGFFGFFFDNTIPGTAEERGIRKWQEVAGNDADSQNAKVNELVNRCYEFPFGMSYIRKVSCFAEVPFCPTFRGWACSCKKKQDSEEGEEMDIARTYSSTSALSTKM